jgi:hypothetical protein
MAISAFRTLDGGSIYSSGASKSNFDSRNQYFEPLKHGFRGKNAGRVRVRKNDRFVEPASGERPFWPPRAAAGEGGLAPHEQ